MKQWLQDYFTFNRKERNGIAVLLVLIAFLLVCLTWLKNNGPDAKQVTEQIIPDAAPKESPALKEPLTLQPSGSLPGSPANPSYFYFDPNRISSSEWQKLGLSEKQAHIIQNYLSKGGVFRRKEDLGKIYGLKPEQIHQLEAWVNIPADSLAGKARPVKERLGTPAWAPAKSRLVQRLELNGADSLSLLSLPCIGPAYSKRILIYRNKLGGFTNVQQLMEVYGFDAERFHCLEERVSVDVSLIRHLSINRLSIDSLKTHPYIGRDLARLIVAYRKQHGAFREAGELKGLDLVDTVLFRKIAPYISVL